MINLNILLKFRLLYIYTELSKIKTLWKNQIKSLNKCVAIRSISTESNRIKSGASTAIINKYYRSKMKNTCEQEFHRLDRRLTVICIYDMENMWKHSTFISTTNCFSYHLPNNHLKLNRMKTK